MEEIEYAQKTINVKSEEQFLSMFNEMMTGWKDYKKLDSRMKLLDASVKKYMLDKNMKTYENKNGSVMIMTQNRRVLDRSLIEEIEQYKVDAEFKMMYKSPN